jgi:hypothetical protein
VGHGESDDVVVRFDEEGDDRRFSWRFGVRGIVEGDDQAHRGLGLDHSTDDIDDA